MQFPTIPIVCAPLDLVRRVAVRPGGTVGALIQRVEEIQVEREVVSGAGLPSRSVSHAVRAGGFVFVSGQPGVDPETGEPAGPSFGEQAHQSFNDLDTVLGVAGSRTDLDRLHGRWRPMTKETQSGDHASRRG